MTTSTTAPHPFAGLEEWLDHDKAVLALHFGASNVARLVQVDRYMWSIGGSPVEVCTLRRFVQREWIKLDADEEHARLTEAGREVLGR